MTCRSWLPGFTALVVALSAGPAAAQELGAFLGSDLPFDLRTPDQHAVAQRDHPELDPIGISAGRLIVYPSIDVGAGYTTNVYGAATNATGDAFATIGPRVDVLSQWSRDRIELIAASGIKEFATQSIRSQAAYEFSANGRKDLGSATDTLYGEVDRRRLYESQYAGTFPQNAAGTIGYNETDALVRGHFVFDRVALAIGEKVQDLAYSNAATLAGTVLDQSFRNRTDANTDARLQYAFTPDVAVFSEGEYIKSTYHQATVDQPKRSNTGYRLIVGSSFDINHLIRGAIGLGYERRIYDLAAVYAPIGGFAFDGRVEWLVTELTTVNVQATRKINDATGIRSPGYFSEIFQLHVDHELLRYVVVKAEVSRERDSFQSLDRRDTQTQAQLSANYALNRHMSLIPAFWYIVRRSQGTVPGPEFDEFRATLSFSFRW